MSNADSAANSTLTLAMQAVWNLLQQGLEQFENRAWADGLVAHAEIEAASIARKTSPFYRHLVPLRQHLVGLVADSYRRFFRLALAHPTKTGNDPHAWVVSQLQPVFGFAIDWVREWYVLACDGENQSVRHEASVPFVPGGQVSAHIPGAHPPPPGPTGWRAPAWLFQISIALVGVGPLKQNHIPDNNSEAKLGEAHTRLLLKGARRILLWELGSAIETVANEEIAAAGAIPAETTKAAEEEAGQKSPKRRLTGTNGLGPKKADLSHYMHGLTEKQHLAFSLKYEYALGLAEISSRMGLDRKTAYEHIEAAKRKIDQARSNEKGKARRVTSEDE